MFWSHKKAQNGGWNRTWLIYLYLCQFGKLPLECSPTLLVPEFAEPKCVSWVRGAVFVYGAAFQAASYQEMIQSPNDNSMKFYDLKMAQGCEKQELQTIDSWKLFLVNNNSMPLKIGVWEIIWIISMI